MRSVFNRRDFLRLSSATIGGAFTWVHHPLTIARANVVSMVSRSSVLQPIAQLLNNPWTRKHDLPGSPLIPNAAQILYPNSLEALINICANRTPTDYFKAAGSHWALSEAAISDKVFVETHDPNNAFPAMDRTLYDVVPNCLQRSFLDRLGHQYPEPFDESHVNNSVGTDINRGTYLVHVEAGKRIYQLYAELDLGDDQNEKSLARKIKAEYSDVDGYGENSHYLGPWAFETLGGAGGQTVFGALTTGTHGGDFHLPPIADSVVALHLVADGGKHYWIEPQQSLFGDVAMTDDNALKALYDTAQYGGVNGAGKNFEIIRDDNIFNAVLVSAGRFGIVYSIVLRAVRQYSLHEERRLSTWQTVKSQVRETSGALYTQTSNNDKYSQRFLQIAICLTPHGGFEKNLCSITKRWNAPMAVNPTTSVPSGRDERRGKGTEKAGKSYPYRPNPDKPNQALPPTFLERACSNGDFLVGVLEAVIGEIQNIIDKHKVAIGGAIAAVTTLGGHTLLDLPLSTILPLLLAFLAWLRAQAEPRLGGVLNVLRDQLLNRSDPAERAAGLLAWQLIAYQIFKSQQADMDYEAISYAVMDTHDYRDVSCQVNVDSIEVFFDATDARFIAFVDALIAFEIKQETQGKAMVGYVSLRFTGRTRALLGMQRYPVTCAIEVAGLKDVEGTKELIDYAVSLSRDKNFGGILHWGQRNESTAGDIAHRFGCDLLTWRKALACITDNGRLNGFSSSFTRRVGLEVTGEFSCIIPHSNASQ